MAASASIQSPTPWLILTTVLYCWEEVLFFVLKCFSPNLTVLILIKWFSSVQRMRLQKVLKSELRFPSRNPPMNIVAIQFSSTFWHARIRLRCFRSCLQLSNGDMWVTHLLVSWSLCDSFAGCPFIEFLLCSRPSICKTKKSSCSCWIELESFADNLMALTRLMGTTLLPNVLRYLLSSWYLDPHETPMVWLVSLSCN